MAENDPLLGHGRQIVVCEDWLRLTEEPIRRARAADRRSPSSSLGARRRAFLPVAAAPGRHVERPRRASHHLRAVRGDVPRLGAGRGTVGG